VKAADEVVKGTLFRMGSAAPLDGGLSWAPLEPGREQPINCYLVTEGDRATLVDTGPALFRSIILEQLKAIRPANVPLTAFMTRSELECSGNLAAIHEDDPVARVIIGGGQNPFDGYDQVTSDAGSAVERQALPNTGDINTPLGDSTRLLLIPARFRILTTYWLYDKQTRTLFCSDVFGHTSHRPGESAVLASVAEDTTTRESAERHLFAKFAWLLDARTRPLQDWLERLFGEIDVENLAPTHGRVLCGRVLVEKHFGIVQDILRSVERGDYKELAS